MVKKRVLLYRDFLFYLDLYCRRVTFFLRNSVVTLVYEVIKLEGPRAYVINRHPEQVDFVECGENV